MSRPPIHTGCRTPGCKRKHRANGLCDPCLSKKKRAEKGGICSRTPARANGTGSGLTSQEQASETSKCRDARNLFPEYDDTHPLADRFWAKVPDYPGDLCWEWQGTIADTGYGRIPRPGCPDSAYAHRVSYEIFKGPIPEGLQVDHLCRNRPCVNPSHLEAVTQRENILRSDCITAVNARKTHCVNGHEFTPENTYHRPDRTGRQCKTCNLERTRRRSAALTKGCRDCGAAATVSISYEVGGIGVKTHYIELLYCEPCADPAERFVRAQIPHKNFVWRSLVGASA